MGETMEIDKDKCVGCGNCHTICPMGAIYLGEDGKSTVIEAAPEYKVLAVGELDDGFMASPAVSGDALYLRTRKHLYRIEESQ